MNNPVSTDFESLRLDVLNLAQSLDAEASVREADIDAVLPKHQASARNLAHYIAMRRQDVRALQLALAARGLSSLGRSEGHVHDTVDWLVHWLSDARSQVTTPRPYPDADEAERLLHRNARALFGPRPRDRHVYIMVTAPDAILATNAWADSLIEAGANLLRINAAHESPREWTQITATFRARAAAAGVEVRVVVDLPGPKLRTDICEREAGLIHIRRSKDSVGRTTTPSRVHLVATASAPDEIPVPAAWLPKLRRGDIVWVTQPDGRRRRLTVASVHAGGVDAHCTRSLYVVAGAALEWHRKTHRVARAKVGDIAEVPRRVTLCVGDLFLVNADGVPDMPGRIALALRAPEVLSAVRAGERVLLDDGRVVATVQSTGPNGLLCAVTAAVKPSVRLRSGKGIAFPDSDLRLDALGEDDEVALAFALEHADAAGVSFVNDAADVDRVGERIGRSARPGFGMILKLETRSAMRNLQSILFQARHYDPVGLMIARGDLAIDIGFARLAEIQEELLWFGEACHLPVVWATQVLESVTHTGLPTRAEVTDAAMSMRAECVMLNKGPHVATANRFLADIIRRMEMHQYKKRALYRPLSLASLLPDNAPPG